MSQTNDPLFVGQAGTPYDTTGRTFPGTSGAGIVPAQLGGFQISPMQRIFIGAPVVAAANNICAAQAIAGAANALINGALASGGVATIDFARCPVMVSSDTGDTTQTVTITGTDMYGVTLTQVKTLNGTTTVTFTKAFKTVTRVAVSAAMTGNLTVGTSNVFGLPFYVPNRDHMITFWNNATITTGTFTAGDTTSPATSSTTDVRGTFLVPDAPDASKRLTIWFSPAATATNTITLLYGVAQV